MVVNCGEKLLLLPNKYEPITLPLEKHAFYGYNRSQSRHERQGVFPGRFPPCFGRWRGRKACAGQEMRSSLALWCIRGACGMRRWMN